MHSFELLSDLDFISCRVALAEKFRTRTSRPEFGFVYLFQDEFVGWSLEFPQPCDWRPGVIAVSDNWQVYLVFGGDFLNGGKDVARLYLACGPAEEVTCPDSPHSEDEAPLNKIPFIL